jgi:acyl carrier protein
MHDRDDRLVRCFRSVFPTLTPDQVRAASVESLEAWDSLATVTLVALIGEEFGVQIDLSDLPELCSFEAFQNLLHRRSLL